MKKPSYLPGRQTTETHHLDGECNGVIRTAHSAWPEVPGVIPYKGIFKVRLEPWAQG